MITLESGSITKVEKTTTLDLVAFFFFTGDIKEKVKNYNLDELLVGTFFEITGTGISSGFEGEVT